MLRHLPHSMRLVERGILDIKSMIAATGAEVVQASGLRRASATGR
jgi:hypothetical protein